MSEENTTCACACGTGEKKKLLDYEGLKYILRKLTGKICLAVGCIKTDEIAPAHLKKTYDDEGIVLTVSVDEATTSNSGVVTADDMVVFKKICNMIKYVWEAHITYDAPVLELSVDDAPAAGGQAFITCAWTQKYTYLDGTTGTASGSFSGSNNTNAGGAEISYALTYIAAGAEVVLVNSGAGVVNVAACDWSTRWKVATVAVTVSANGQTTTKEIDVYQEAAVISYGELSVELSYDEAPAEGGELTPTYSYKLPWTSSSGSSGTITSGATLEWGWDGSSGVEIDAATGVLTVPENTSTERLTLGGATLAVIYADNAGATAVGSKQVTVYQAAAEAKEVTYTYETPVVELSYDTMPATGGSIEPTVAWTQAWSGSDGTSGVITSDNPTLPDGSPLTDSDTVYSWNFKNSVVGSDFSLDTTTGVITTTTKNTDTDSIVYGIVKVTVTVNGMTGEGYANVSQEGMPVVNGGDGNKADDLEPTVTITYEEPVVELSYDTLPYNGGSVSPVYSYSQKWTGSDGTSGTITGDNDNPADGVELYFSAPKASSYLGQSIDAQTGVVTVPAMETTSEDGADISLFTVELQVTLNGVSGTGAAEVMQATELHSDTLSEEIFSLISLDAGMISGSNQNLPVSNLEGDGYATGEPRTISSSEYTLQAGHSLTLTAQSFNLAILDGSAGYGMTGVDYTDEGGCVSSASIGVMVYVDGVSTGSLAGGSVSSTGVRGGWNTTPVSHAGSQTIAAADHDRVVKVQAVVTAYVMYSQAVAFIGTAKGTGTDDLTYESVTVDAVEEY